MSSTEKSVSDIISAISTVYAQYGYDGALDDEGKPVKIGLAREESGPIRDSRVMDGFHYKLSANIMTLVYDTNITVEQAHKKEQVESEVEDYLDSIAAFLKKEYRKKTGQTLTLKKEGGTNILMEPMSQIRVIVTATRKYKIAELKDLEIDGKVKSPKGESFKGEIDVVIVPALHVDRQGNRLGQGGGSYDRALAKLNSWKVALVYSGELTSEKLPVESFDCKLDAAATPEILVRFTAKN